MRWLPAIALAGLMSVSVSHGSCPDQKFSAADSERSDVFGASVSVSGVVALIGMPGDDEGGSHAGSAHVFRHDGSEWVEEAKLIAGDAAPDDSFGESVSMSGGVALVGSYLDDDAGSDSGSAYVFRHDGSDWVFEAKLVAADAAPGDHFGESVSLSGDLALIGARGDDDPNGSGAAYIFRYDGSTWVEEAKLEAADNAAGDYFGLSVSLSGDVALIGAYFDDDGGDRTGSAYIFRHDGSAWVEEAKLVAADADENDELGFDVSVSGDVALVTAIGDDDGGFSAGAVYVFRHDGATWAFEAKLVASDAEGSERFGDGISVLGDVALVGTMWDDGGAGPSSGSAYLFRHENSEWVEEARLVPCAHRAGDEFGNSVALGDDLLLVGARGDGATYAGSVHSFSLDASETCSIAEISPPGLSSDDGVFLVEKEAAELRLSWQASAHQVSIYVGSLDALHGVVGYDHRASSACALDGTESVLTDSLSEAAYLLVVGYRVCPREEGSLGTDSLGGARPSAEFLGQPRCP